MTREVAAPRLTHHPIYELTMTLLMTPDKANFSGKVHGGAMLKHLDEVAYACAARYCGGYAVTMSVDQVSFDRPIHVGELVTFLASVNFTGRTSMEVGIKVVAEEVSRRACRHAMTCYFTMVAVDEAGRPTEVPPLLPATPAAVRRFEAAKRRRKLRAEILARQEKIKHLTGN
ncbi:MAG: acyl-CoA thioesterase [Myxococcota bacterium]